MEPAPPIPQPAPPPSSSKANLALLLGLAPPLTLISGVPLLFLAAPIFILPAIILAIGALRQSRRIVIPGARGKSIAAIILSCIWSVLYAALLWILQGLGNFHGRPFRVRGKVRLAPSVPGDAWASAGHADASGLDPDTRDRLASVWLERARAEHASIAAFSRLSLDLMAVGAPPELLEACHRAAIEEIGHARMSFALASGYAGKSVSAGPFPEAAEPADTRASAKRQDRLIELAVESLQDGCLGEGVAAKSAAEDLHGAQDLAVRHALRRIVEEEASHAELAWAIVSWCLKEGGAPVLSALLNSIRSLEALNRGNGLSRTNDKRMVAHGWSGSGVDSESWRELLTEAHLRVGQYAAREPDPRERIEVQLTRS